MYQVGDYVVYRILSVCKIQGMETPSFESDKEKKYYKLSPVFDNSCGTTIYVPLTACDSLRPLFKAEDITIALRELPALKATACTLKKPPQVIAYYQEILSSCDLKRYLSLLKEVRTKEKSSTKKLSEIDQRFYQKTERLLSEEFAVVFNEMPETMKTKIHQRLD